MLRTTLAGIFLTSFLALGQTQFEVLTDEIQLRPDGASAHLAITNQTDPVIETSVDGYGMVGDWSNSFYRVFSDYVHCDVLYESSDERLKEQVQDLNANVLTKMKSVRPVSYLRKGVAADSRSFNGREVGFLAQNLKETFPEVVRYEKKKDQYSVQYTRMVPILIKAIQEQQAQIEDLKARLEAAGK